MTKSRRLPFIDLTRFLAIFLMIIFHLTYDLNFFGIKIFSQKFTLFWHWLPRFIVFLFMLAVGMSIGAKKNPAMTESFNKSQIKILLGALLISLVTYFLYPSRWVYFGTLHCIFLSRYIVIWISRYSKTCLLLFFLINIPLFFGIKYPWFNLSHQSMDYIPLLPWVSYAFLGVFLSQTNLPNFGHKLAEVTIIKKMSTNSFWIYLVHQPLLFGLSYLIYVLLKTLN